MNATSRQSISTRVTVRTGIGAALIAAWLVFGPSMPDSSITAAAYWYLLTAGFAMVITLWVLLPWMRDDARGWQVEEPASARSGVVAADAC